MGSFVDNSLLSGEKIDWVATVSWVSQFAFFFVAALFLVFSASIGVVGLFFSVMMIVAAVINVTSVELAITNKKVIGKCGFIRRSSIDIPINKLESINIGQSIAGRILGYGTVSIRGVGGNNVSIPFIKKPYVFRKRVMELMDSIPA